MTATCRRCDCAIEYVDGAGWVATEPDTTADGLAFCPPDPDREPVGDHVPALGEVKAPPLAPSRQLVGTYEPAAQRNSAGRCAYLLSTATPYGETCGRPAAGKWHDDSEEQFCAAHLGDEQAAAELGICPNCFSHTEYAEPDCGHCGHSLRRRQNQTNEENDAMITANGEATNITTALEFARQMTAQANSGATEVEAFTNALQTSEVSGRPIELATQAHELFVQLADVFGQLTAELEQHLVVQDAYAAVGDDAGSKQFNTAT